jgi:hypothetical protein
LDLADVDKAISLLQQGLETAKRVAILDPDCTESRDLAAKMHSKLSDCLLIKGDLESACKQLEASLQAREDQYARDTADRSAQWGFLLASLKMAQHHALRGAAHRGKVFLDKFSTTLAKCHASLGDEFAELEMQTRMLIREAEEGRRSSAAELRKAMTEMYGTLNRMHRQASSDDRTEAAFSGRAYPDADGTKAAELNIRFQEAVATWSALPWWKRWRVKKPARPKGI